jgi:PilZ domain-containing protein
MTAPANGAGKDQADKITGDRRSDRRYALHLGVRWKLIRRRRVLESGEGTTVDMSSGGILLQTDRQLPVGLQVELSISWPVLLHNVAPMQLVILGRVVRIAGQHAGIRIAQHEFRTVGVPSGPAHAKVTAVNGSRLPSRTPFHRKTQ